MSTVVVDAFKMTMTCPLYSLCLYDFYYYSFIDTFLISSLLIRRNKIIIFYNTLDNIEVLAKIFSRHT